MEGRIELKPDGPLKAGEPNEIPLVVHGPSVSCVLIGQTGADRAETLPILHRQDGTPYIVFIPTRLGKTEIAIWGVFSDGGFSSANTTVEVAPSDRVPAALILQSGGSPDRDTDLLRIGLSDRRWNQTPTQWERLYAAAYYLDSKKPVEIDPAYLRYSVKQLKGKPAIEVSQDGGMRPLGIGDALLSITFGKITREACIQVRSDALRGDNSRCGQMRSAQPVGPLETVWTVDPDGLGSEISGSEFFVSRLSFEPPNHPVEAAQAFEIPVAIKSGKIRQIGFEQKRAGSDSTISFNWVVPHSKPATNADLQDGHFLEGPEGSKIFQLIPVEVGEETVRIFARFEDGGFDERFFHLKTEMTERNLERIEIQYVDYPPGKNPHMVVGLKYRQLSNGIIVHTLDGLHVSVTPPDVVRFDSDGTAHEMRAGTAIVHVRFGSIEGKEYVRINGPHLNLK